MFNPVNAAKLQATVLEAKKLNACVRQYTTYTGANLLTIYNALNGGNGAPFMENCTQSLAHDMPINTITIMPIVTAVNAVTGAVNCATTHTQFRHPAAKIGIFIKIEKPASRQVDTVAVPAGVPNIGGQNHPEVVFEYIGRTDVSDEITFGAMVNVIPHQDMFRVANEQNDGFAGLVEAEQGKKARAILADGVAQGTHSTTAATVEQKDVYTLMTPIMHLFDSLDAYHTAITFQTGGLPPTDRAHAREIDFHGIETRANVLLRDTVDPGIAGTGLQVTKKEVIALLTLRIGTGKDHVTSNWFKKKSATDADAANREINTRVLAAVLGALFGPFLEAAIYTLAVDIRNVLRPRSPEEFTLFLDEYLTRLTKAPDAAKVDRATFRAWVLATLTVSKTDAAIDRYRTDQDRTDLDAVKRTVTAQAAEIKNLRARGPGKDGTPASGDKKRKESPHTGERDANPAFEAESKAHMAARPFPLPAAAQGKDYCKNLTRGAHACNNLKYRTCPDHHDKAPWMTDTYITWLSQTPAKFAYKDNKASKK